MVTLSMGADKGKIFSIPTFRELRDAMNDRAVAITALIAGALVAVVFLAGAVFLAYTGKGTDALTGAGMIGLVTALVSLYQKTKAQDTKLEAIERHVTSDGGGSDGR